MSNFKEKLSNHKAEIIIGNLLRTGVIIAAITVIAGGIIYLLHHGGRAADYKVFLGEPSSLCNIKGILMHAFSGEGRGLIQLGLLLLIATPVARVGFSIFLFICQKDFLYVIITLIVFGVLIYSLLNS